MAVVEFAEPLRTAAGLTVENPTVRYETYGTLDAQASNAVLVCHSLTRDAHAARRSPAGDDAYAGDRAEAPGWWDAAIGPGRMLDTDRFFVVCASTLAARGSSGPAAVQPGTGRRYGARFPVVEVRDMAEAHHRLLAHLGIRRLHLAIGGCFGGQQVLELAIRHPETVADAVVISTTPATSAHSIAIFAAMRRLIRTDPHWNGGDYYDGPFPSQGIGNAIAVGVPLWMSRESLQARFGRDRAEPAGPPGLDAEFAVEHFIERLAARAPATIDPNSLIYLTRAVEYFDLAREYGSLRGALASVTARTLFVSYADDWRYPAHEADLMHRELASTGRGSRHVVLDSAYGHGAFLLDPSGLDTAVAEFLARPPAESAAAELAGAGAAPDGRKAP